MATTRQTIQKGVREMLKHFTDCPAENIVSGDSNRISLPSTNNYIIFTVLNPVRYGTPREVTTRLGWTSYQTYRIVVQIDFYGEFAFDRASDIINISRTEHLCSFLKQYDVQPIACDDARHLTGVSGEKEYVERYAVDLELEYQDAVIDSQGWFNTAELNIFETEL